MSNDRPATSLGTGQAYRLFAVSLFLVVVIGFVVQSFAPRTGLAITEVLLILLPAVLFVRRKGLAVRTGLRWTPVSALEVLLSSAVGISGWGIAVGIYLLVTQVLGAPATQMPDSQSADQWLILLAVGAVLPGICEEALFRGAIQGVLERRGAARAVVITAILFGVFHLDPWRLLSAIFLGLLYGTLVVRTNSVIPAVLAHSCNNATAISVGFLSSNSDAAIATLLWILIPTFLICTALYWRLLRSREIKPSPLARVPASYSWRRFRLLKIILAVTVFLLVSIVVGIVSVFQLDTVKSTDLAPNLSQGDRVLIVLDRQGNLPVVAGDVVSYRREESKPAVLGRVTRVDGSSVWIADPAGEFEIARHQVLGRIVYPVPNR
jgi:membrane protease YdiL (CAAX protease family)